MKSSVRFITLLAALLLLVPASGAAAKKRGFKIIQRVPVYLLAERHYLFDPLGQVFPGAGHRFLHAIKEAGFLLLVEAAKESLNHEIFGKLGVLNQL